MGDKSGDRESERGGDAGRRRWGIKAGNGLWVMGDGKNEKQRAGMGRGREGETRGRGDGG